MRKFSSWRLVFPVLVAALVIVLTFAFAGAAAPGPSVQANASGVVPHNPTGVLYDQTNDASGNGAPAQDFEATYNAYDSEGADDFVVPANTQWTIDGVTIVGTSAGATPSVDIAIYPDSATFPGATAACSYLNVTTLTGTGTLNITLPTTCVLGPGTYWLAFMANQNFATSGQYFWSNRTSQSNNGGVWRNPGGGFATGCVAWQRQTICGVGGGASPDFLFQISGTAGPVGAPEITLEKTVGTDPNTCATTTSISVGYGSTVYYCYTVTNTGNVTLTGHTLTDDVLGTVLGPDFAYNLAPSASAFVTASYVLTGTSVTNTALWEASINSTVVATATASATVTGTPTDVTISGVGGQTTSNGVVLAAAVVVIFVMGAALYLRRQHN